MTLTLASCLVLSACGGGGSDSSTSSQVSTTNTQTNTATHTDTSTNQDSLDNLIISRDNDLSSNFTLSLDVKTEKTIYLSICDQYKQEKGAYKVDYDSCIFRSNIDEKGLKNTLTVANHYQDLIIAAWYFDGTPPHYQTWQNPLSKDETLSLEFN
jgi:hypothetical protein